MSAPHMVIFMPKAVAPSPLAVSLCPVLRQLFDAIFSTYVTYFLRPVSCPGSVAAPEPQHLLAHIKLMCHNV
jgi:hypothetical protein